MLLLTLGSVLYGQGFGDSVEAEYCEWSNVYMMKSKNSLPRFLATAEENAAEVPFIDRSELGGAQCFSGTFYSLGQRSASVRQFSVQGLH